MKGYLAFVLAFVSISLALSLMVLMASSGRISLSKAVSVERTYGLQMNAKESILETARQWGRKGFMLYGSTHSPDFCKHCPDHFCIPWVPPEPPPDNRCDEAACSACFREDEARRFSETGVAIGLASLSRHEYDPDFSIVIAGGSPEASLAADPVGRGYILDSIRFREPLKMHVGSEKLGITSDSMVPAGMVVRCG